jgi:hypothetical protein
VREAGRVVDGPARVTACAPNAMFKALKRFWHQFWQAGKQPEPDIVVGDDGFSVARGGQTFFRVHWSDVREVFAFKRDLGTYDEICVGFRISDQGDYYEVNEDSPGYNALLAAVARAFTGYDNDWWHKVAFPAFATNRTTLWGTPMPNWTPASPKSEQLS